MSSPEQAFDRRFILVAGSLLMAFAVNSARGDTQSISRASAVVDGTIPASVRHAFEDDDGRPLKSVPVDLDDDGYPEKLVLNEFLCGNGGCPWVIYSPRLNKVIGRVFGNSITVLETSSEGYKRIRTRWSLGADKPGAAEFDFRSGGYERAK